MFAETEDNQTFFTACILYFFLRMEWGIATSMLPIYVHELGGSPLEVGLIFTLFAGIITFAHPFWGAYSDRIGRRKILMNFGMIGLACIFLIMSFQKNPFTLTLLRGSTAIFAGAIVSSTLALVSDISPPKIVGKNMGYVDSFGMAGFGVGPMIGGFIADSYGFSALWLFVAIICLIGGFVFYLGGRDPKGLKKNMRQTQFFYFFKNREIRSKISALSASFCVFLLGYALMGPNYNVFFVKNLGLSKTIVGIISFIGTFILALVQPIVGLGSDKYGRKSFFVLGAVGLTLGNLVLLVTTDLSLAFFAWILISLYNIFQLMGSAYITDFIPQEMKAGALGLFNSVGSLTRSFGAAVGGLIISATSINTLLSISATFTAFSIVIILLSLKE